MYLYWREWVPPKFAKVYKGGEGEKAMNIERTYFLNGP